MTIGNGNGSGATDVSRFRFTLSQVMQVVIMLVSLLLAWGNLKGDMREGFGINNERLRSIEERVSRIEARADRESSRGR